VGAMILQHYPFLSARTTARPTDTKPSFASAHDYILMIHSNGTGMLDDLHIIVHHRLCLEVLWTSCTQQLMADKNEAHASHASTIVSHLCCGSHINSRFWSDKLLRNLLPRHASVHSRPLGHSAKRRDCHADRAHTLSVRQKTPEGS
jgi:hypothetical protein